MICQRQFNSFTYLLLTYVCQNDSYSAYMRPFHISVILLVFFVAFRSNLKLVNFLPCFSISFYYYSSFNVLNLYHLTHIREFFSALQNNSKSILIQATHKKYITNNVWNENYTFCFNKHIILGIGNCSKNSPFTFTIYLDPFPTATVSFSDLVIFFNPQELFYMWVVVPESTNHRFFRSGSSNILSVLHLAIIFRFRLFDLIFSVISISIYWVYIWSVSLDNFSVAASDFFYNAKNNFRNGQVLHIGKLLLWNSRECALGIYFIPIIAPLHGLQSNLFFRKL